MQFIDYSSLDGLGYESFRATQPYPWANPTEVLIRQSFDELLANLPDISMFKKTFGVKRANGQKSHNRYSLKYQPGLDIPEVWQAFIDELTGEEYIGFLEDLFKARSIKLDMFWYYTPNGCFVSPHCDHLRKLGAQIFYLNPEDDWDPSWGGETLILDDGGRLPRKSAPKFDDFDKFIAPPASGNQSLIFARTRHSWHGVREITCPEERLRKIFLVTIKTDSEWEIFKRRFDWW